MEVGDPAIGADSIFLHVFELTDEGVAQPTPVTQLPPAGVTIGTQWRVRFNAVGALDGSVNDRQVAADGREMILGYFFALAVVHSRGGDSAARASHNRSASSPSRALLPGV